MAALPAGEPGVRPPGDDPGAGAPRRHRLSTALLVVLSGLAALGIAQYAGVTGRSAVDEALRAGAVAIALFAVCGFGIVRLFLPAELRAHELLWILPAGAAAAAVELAVLGYLHVPLVAGLVAIGVANAALAALAIARRGLPSRPPVLGAVGWPAWIALLIACVALIPMFRAGFATVEGYGSDAHLAAGTAEFLKHHAPGQVAPEEPVDMVPLVWRSKPPIYYVMAATSELSGLETWEVFATLAAVMLALAALGFYLLAREGLGVGLAGAAVAMAVVGLDRVALQTTMHPYYNQLWGFFTLPFALLLAYWTARARTRGAGALLALFLVVGAFAYPLAVPIPLIALAVLLWPERRRLRVLWGGRRSLWWMVPLGLVLLVPLLGVTEKMASAVSVVADPGRSLRSWGGDLTHFIPEHQFFALPSTALLIVLGPVLAVLIVLELRRQPRGLALGLGGVLLFGALAAAWFRPRDFGWYFHFKALAFIGPLAVLIAVAALSRLRGRWGVAVLCVAVLLAIQGARDEMVVTFDQTPKTVTDVRQVDAMLPQDASVRLDMPPEQQLWVGYFLAGQPLCSRKPLLNTSYPHVPVSATADYALVHVDTPRPADATGGVLWDDGLYRLYRLRDSGPQNCSQRMIQTITSVPIT